MKRIIEEYARYRGLVSGQVSLDSFRMIMDAFFYLIVRFSFPKKINYNSPLPPFQLLFQLEGSSQKVDPTKLAGDYKNEKVLVSRV